MVEHPMLTMWRQRQKTDEIIYIDAISDPLCCAESPLGMRCTKPTGHAGKHWSGLRRHEWTWTSRNDNYWT